jgi:putative flippase GtrA
MNSRFTCDSNKEKSKNVNQIFWFIIAGTVGFIVDAGVLEFLVRYTDAGLFIGRIISFSIAVVVTWKLNRLFTFKQEAIAVIGVKKALSEFFKYLLSSSLSIAINFSIYTFSIFSFTLCREIPSLAVVLGSLGAMFVTFFMSKYWVFK